MCKTICTNAIKCFYDYIKYLSFLISPRTNEYTIRTNKTYNNLNIFKQRNFDLKYLKDQDYFSILYITSMRIIYIILISLLFLIKIIFRKRTALVKFIAYLNLYLKMI